MTPKDAGDSGFADSAYPSTTATGDTDGVTSMARGPGSDGTHSSRMAAYEHGKIKTESTSDGRQEQHDRMEGKI